MVLTADALLQLIHSTKSFSIWDRAKGPVFWYALGVPGPFYINVEQIIGKAEAKALLDSIDTILAATKDLAERADRLDQAVMRAYTANPVYQQLVATMAAAVREKFAPEAFCFISGGERRDWFFSIPLAQELGLKHVYLFKDKRLFCRDALEANAAGLHIADLINNAASYFDAWLPILKQAGLSCHGTLCVVARGGGVQKLLDAGVKTIALQKIDLGFFEQSASAGLIDEETLQEISTYDVSPGQWASRYLIGRPELFDMTTLDRKSFERMQVFFSRDPWGLRAGHTAFFQQIDGRIGEQKNRRAASA